MSVIGKANWHDYKAQISDKRGGKKERKADASGILDGSITVQRLSSEVEGKSKKYSRMGPLTLVPFDKEHHIGKHQRCVQKNILGQC